MKRRVIKEYNNLPVEVKQAISVDFPEGIEDALTSMIDIKGKYFQGMTFEFEDVIYLVKYTDDSKFLYGEDDDDDEDDNDDTEDVGEEAWIEEDY